MSIKPIVTIPDPILREVSKPVERIDDELLALLDDMLETMYDAPGIGLAAIQVGIPLRLVTIDVGKRRLNETPIDEDELEEEAEEATTEPDPLFLINPEIVHHSDERSVYDEGCLSIPEYFAEVERPAICTINYLDREGKQQTLEADDLLSTCIQHELDHLDGTLFIDHISKLKRDRVIKKFTKMAKHAAKTNPL